MSLRWVAESAPKNHLAPTDPEATLFSKDTWSRHLLTASLTQLTKPGSREGASSSFPPSKRFSLHAPTDKTIF